MSGIWKDKQTRMAIRLLTLVFAILTASGCLLLYHNGAQTTRALVRQDVALAGGMARGKSTAELSIVTGTVENKDLEAGTRLLSPYGYGESMPPAATRYYGNLFGWQIALFCLCAAVLYLASLVIFIIFHIRSEHRLRAFARRVEAGDFRQEKDLSQGESGFDVMRNTVASLVKGTSFHAQALQKDKEYLRDLLSDISHQMKTPLAALRMYHELLANPNLSLEKRDEFLRRSQKQVERTDWLVQSLLKMARIESGSVTMNRRQAYLLDTAELASAPFSASAEQKGVELVLSVSPEICFLHDTDWVAEAIGNLIKNALEHTPVGGHIRVDASETPLSVELCVSDDGEGMTGEEIPHAFERFYRADSKQESGGVGIGLSLAKEIIEKNGGDIFVRSQPGNGSTFTVTFLKGWQPPGNGNLKKS